MTDQTIPPALTREEWAEVTPNLADEIGYIGWISTERRMPAAIAILNAALPSDHPAKITREMVTRIQHAGHYAGNGREVMTPDKLDALLRIAAALESYLPPLL